MYYGHGLFTIKLCYNKLYDYIFLILIVQLFNNRIGYANEVGESFRALVHVNWVRLSYGVAFAYVLADTRDKTLKVQSPVLELHIISCCQFLNIKKIIIKSVHVPHVATSAKNKYYLFFQDTSKKMIAATDTLVWQTLASVAIPGFTINRTCALSLFLLAKSTKLSLPVRKWTTTAIGLGMIPFIVHPIDRLVDVLMDNTFRVVFPPAAR